MIGSAMDTTMTSNHLLRAHFSSSGSDKILLVVSSVVVSGLGVVVGGAVGL